MTKLRIDPANTTAAISALERLTRRPRNETSTVDSNALTTVYVQGFSRGPLKEFKQALRDLRFRTSAIPCISFVGTSTTEFLVAATYAPTFIRRIQTLSESRNYLRVLDGYQANEAADPNASSETRERLLASFTKRIHNILIKTNHAQTTRFYSNWLSSLKLPLPTGPRILTDIQTETQTDVQTEAQIDVQTEAQTDVQIDAQTDAQTDENADIAMDTSLTQTCSSIPADQ